MRYNPLIITRILSYKIGIPECRKFNKNYLKIVIFLSNTEIGKMAIKMYFDRTLNSPQIKYDSDNEKEVILAAFISGDIGTSDELLSRIKEMIRVSRKNKKALLKKGKIPVKKGKISRKKASYAGEICTLFVELDGEEVTIQDNEMLYYDFKAFRYKRIYLQELLKDWEKLLRQVRREQT